MHYNSFSEKLQNRVPRVQVLLPLPSKSWNRWYTRVSGFSFASFQFCLTLFANRLTIVWHFFEAGIFYTVVGLNCTMLFGAVRTTAFMFSAYSAIAFLTALQNGCNIGICKYDMLTVFFPLNIMRLFFNSNYSSNCNKTRNKSFISDK